MTGRTQIVVVLAAATIPAALWVCGWAARIHTERDRKGWRE